MVTKQIVQPREKQLAFQNWEFGLFLHFGLRTFYEGFVDFDKRTMLPSEFNPKHLDCEQWIRTAKEAGMKYAVFTAKHHDGFSNWPSKYTSFSVEYSPWKNGKGDVVGEFIGACRKYGIKPGLYYSPYDGSVDFYKKDPKAYDDYFVNQMTELLTNYGQIDMLWLDGCGSEGHEYNWQRIVREIRRMQPNILIHSNGDPDYRWVGNEDGIAPVPCWNVVKSTKTSILSKDNNQLDQLQWLPAEADVQMRSNWFYSDYDETDIKSVEELMGLYYHSVGRGVNLLLNIGPNREGLLPEKDTQRLLQFGEEIRRRFHNPIGTLNEVEILDGKWVYKPKEPHLIDHVVIQEDLTNGENVSEFQITIKTAKSRNLCTIYQGKNIGHKVIIRIPTVKVAGVFLEIIKTNGNPVIRDLSFYHVGE